MNTTDEPMWDDADSAQFLEHADVFVPRRGEQFHVVCSLLRDLRHPSVLELACGDGALTEQVARWCPDVEVTAFDSSEMMLAVARRRLAAHAARVRLVRADLRESRWRRGRYGAVVTSLAVHHLGHEAKRQLFSAVYDLLRPGGIFVQCDLIDPATHVTRALAAQLWDEVVLQQGARHPGGRAAVEAFEAARWNTFRFPDPVDQPAAVHAQLGWLVEAGFEGVDVCWATAGHAVLTASRTETR